MDLLKPILFSPYKLLKITLTQIKSILRVAGLDYIEYKPSSKKLVITRNPFGFVSIYNKASYKGVQRNDEEGVGIVSEKEFLDRVQSTLAEHQIVMNRKTVSKEKFTCLIDNLDEFNDMFINVADGSIKNNTLFKRRVIGLTLISVVLVKNLCLALIKKLIYTFSKSP